MASAGSTKLDTALVETPQSITVVSANVLEAVGATGFGDVGKYIPGLTPAGWVGPTVAFSSRGQFIGFQNGFKLNGFAVGDGMNLDSVIVSRVEFVKGANSISYGESSASGFVNVISKEPTTDLRADVGAKVGTFGLRRIDGTISGSPFGGLRVLAAGAREEGDSFYKFGRQGTTAAFGAAALDIGDSVTLEARALLQDADYSFNRGMPVVRSANGSLSLPDVPFDYFSGQPWSYNTADLRLVQFSGTYRPTDAWTVLLAGSKSKSDRNVKSAFFSTTVAPNGVGTYLGSRSEGERNSEGAELRVVGEINVFSERDRVMLFAEYRNIDMINNDHTNANLGTNNVFNMNYGIADPFVNSAPSLLRFLSNEILSYAGNVVLNPLDRLVLTLGGRYDDRTGTLLVTEPQTGLVTSAITTQDNTFSPRFGATFKLAERASIYYSYSESIEYLLNLDCTNANPFPVQYEMNELGIKAEFNSGKLLLAGSVFNLDTSKSQIADTRCFPTRTRNGGEANARGVEFEAVGTLADGWEVTAGVTYLNTDVKTASDPLTINRGRPNAPEWNWSIFTVYDLSRTLLPGLSMGIGYAHIGRRPGDARAELMLAAGDIIDVGIYYELNERTRFAFNGLNVTDEDVTDSFNSIFSLYRRPPSSYALSVQYKVR